ncbi:MAG: hypothetical protein ACXACG_07230 [Candidatus Thorarchaeota archaeon]|jgi:hypothetical protein
MQTAQQFFLTVALTVGLIAVVLTIIGLLWITREDVRADIKSFREKRKD